MYNNNLMNEQQGPNVYAKNALKLLAALNNGIACFFGKAGIKKVIFYTARE